VTTRPGEARDKTKPDRVFRDPEDDGDRRGCCFGRQRRRNTSGRDNHGDLPPNQLGRQLRQPIKLILAPTVYDRYVIALDIAGVLEALAKSAQTVLNSLRRSVIKEADHRHRRLLRARREWTRGDRAAEQRDELAPFHHSITLSARTTNVLGTSWPIAFAVLRLMTSWNLVGCSTGRSPGFAPRRSLASCRLMASRHKGTISGP